MDPLAQQLLQHLADYGPGLLFAMAVLETCFVTGLAVPSGLATSVATVLALEGTLSLPQVLGAAALGGWAGDSLGFWVGRAAGERFLRGEGRLARWVGGRHGEASRFFGRHPLFSVTAARLVSFVRTLMPMAAGMSGLAYPRFLAYQAVGLAGWVALYAGIGFLARESWELATRVVGVGGALIFFAVGAGLWVAYRKRRHRRRREGSGGGSG